MATESQVDAFYELLGERVRQGRRSANFSQADLAERLGLTRASIANLEAGRQRPSTHQTAMLADILGIPIEKLVPSAPTAIDPSRAADEALRERARGWMAAVQ